MQCRKERARFTSLSKDVRSPHLFFAKNRCTEITVYLMPGQLSAKNAVFEDH